MRTYFWPLPLRYFAMFVFTFVTILTFLNYRAVMAEIRYQLAPGTIITHTSKESSLPQAPNVEKKPLPAKANLVIDSVGVNAPIVFNIPTEDQNSIYQRLENGVVHYSSTVRPGEPGVALILGHSSAYPWYRGNYGSVFALLGKLNVGDNFYVQYEDGRTFTFKVKKGLIFNPFLTSDAELDTLVNNVGSGIILVSCYPVGTNYRRIAILADLVE